MLGLGLKVCGGVLLIIPRPGFAAIAFGDCCRRVPGFCRFSILAYNLVVSSKRGSIAGNNPWDGRTLEWMVSSPPPENNFDEIPEVLDSPHMHGVVRFGSCQCDTKKRN